MNTPTKLGAFGLGLAVVFTVALGLGRVAGPAPAAPAAAHDQHDEPTGQAAVAVGLPAGLQVTQDGYRLQPISAELGTGAPQPFRFRILEPDGAPVTGYTTSHDKDLHLIVVRRDLAGFQHVHPTLAADGTWSIPLAVAAPGQYRVFADFQPAGHTGGLVLGVDVPAPGDYRPRPLPTVQRETTVDGYTVTLTGDLTPGGSSKLTLAVSKDGTPVTDLQPYLGAYGHLVALREGDLAYLHVHPDGEPGDGRTQAGPDVVFHAEVPSAGNYRLYLDFRHAGTVRTAEFTAVAGTPAPAAEPVPSATTPAPAPSGHDADGHTHQ
ncbi:hypothetical protein Acy02nite_72560 [Actinoplanes cyaneus]|uniref:Secreted protein n=1 Tax=Actinoplanes cyaneus TaxID=52696 RepID=A0A919INL2_9ACTN|nr:hypothetical protein [Actinoplanes cyaneus]MCW2142355.1 hypothetical protein [Actinoplanes cyaneus]GID69375.1 hypothetical protein Acy02nite_72560 [Actinoplanes cyaneus]